MGDDEIIVECGAFNDTAMEEAKKEVGAEEDPTDDLGQAIHNAQENIKVKRKR